MDSKLFGASVIGLFLSFTSMTQAEGFFFPVNAHFPYSQNLIVTAVPDLNPTTGTLRTRLQQTGFSNAETITQGGISAFTKNGGGDWAFDGVRYNDYRGGTGRKYVWYDNHNGYDFISTNMSIAHTIHSVEAGTTCGYSEPFGQICVQHPTKNGRTYRTFYTHMRNIPTSLTHNDGIGNTVTKFQQLGIMAGVSSPNPVGVHLHFVTEKRTSSGQWYVVDPYGHKPGWPSSTADDPNNPYLWN